MSSVSQKLSTGPSLTFSDVEVGGQRVSHDAWEGTRAGQAEADFSSAPNLTCNLPKAHSFSCILVTWSILHFLLQIVQTIAIVQLFPQL